MLKPQGHLGTKTEQRKTSPKPVLSPHSTPTVFSLVCPYAALRDAVSSVCQARQVSAVRCLILEGRTSVILIPVCRIGDILVQRRHWM